MRPCLTKPKSSNKKKKSYTHETKQDQNKQTSKSQHLRAWGRKITVNSTHSESHRMKLYLTKPNKQKIKKKKRLGHTSHNPNVNYGVTWNITADIKGDSDQSFFPQQSELCFLKLTHNSHCYLHNVTTLTTAIQIKNESISFGSNTTFYDENCTM